MEGAWTGWRVQGYVGHAHVDSEVDGTRESGEHCQIQDVSRQLMSGDVSRLLRRANKKQMKKVL